MAIEKRQRIVNAFGAMKNIGIPAEKVKPVLKDLLKLYDKNWELIEEENYRVLADAIFEKEEAQKGDCLDEEAQGTEDPEQPSKRLRLRYEDGPSAADDLSLPKKPLIKPKEEPDVMPEVSALNINQPHSVAGPSQRKAGDTRDKSQEGTCQPLTKNKGKQPVSMIVHDKHDSFKSSDIHKSQQNVPLRIGSRSPSQPMHIRNGGKSSVSQMPEKISSLELSSDTVHFKDPNVDPDNVQPRKRKSVTGHCLVQSNPSIKDASDGRSAQHEPEKNGELSRILDETSANLEIASSSLGEVKISLNCHLALSRPGFCLPDLETILKSVEDKCLKSYKLLDPNISLMNLMQETCECVLKLGTASTDESPEIMGVASTVNLLRKFPAENSAGCKGISNNSLHELVVTDSDAEVILPQTITLPPSHTSLGDGSQPYKMGSGVDSGRNGQNKDNGVEDANFHGLMDTVTEPYKLTPERIGSIHDVFDISKGQEKTMITLVNEVNGERAPSFCYITQNAVFQNADVSFSLARIGDNKCCSTCLRDCLSSYTSCVCGIQTGGDFAYTLNGLVKENFLQECVSMKRDPKKHHQFFCEKCPLKKSEHEGIIEPCTGHLVRAFIKECWWKCGCDKKCGNRVVQRGITCNLQVFMTAEGKGWGLRAMEDLPKGAFVCEYIGEVLTYSELTDRVSQSSLGEMHSNHVFLDADWGSKDMLKEALCLDTTYFGNVARFINHRCHDANLVDIPVEVETPDRHYYHLAFFTARNVKSMEELTWDYGINFNDNDHPIKAFSCLCGSSFCRNTMQFTRSK